MKTLNERKSLKRISVITLIAVYLLILVGGVVRTTGSGMGCPDWPKCFGQYIPPTQESQLPDNYRDDFLNKRLRKAERLSAMLSSLGFEELGSRIINDPNIRVEEPFNATKTWIEYLNRLLGALVGVLCLLTLYFGFKARKHNKWFFVLPFLILVFTLFEGWLGSIVVVTNLIPGTITIHMLLAIGIILLLIYLVYITSDRQNYSSIEGFNYQLPILMIVLLSIQILLGSSVRESVDHLKVSYEGLNRENWLDEIGAKFYIHRTFSLVIVGLQMYLSKVIYDKTKTKKDTIFALSLLIIGITIIEIVSGAWMYYFGIPKFLTPIHLLLSVIMIGLLFFLLLAVGDSRRKIKYQG